MSIIFKIWLKIIETVRRCGFLCSTDDLIDVIQHGMNFLKLFFHIYIVLCDRNKDLRVRCRYLITRRRTSFRDIRISSIFKTKLTVYYQRLLFLPAHVHIDKCVRFQTWPNLVPFGHWEIWFLEIIVIDFISFYLTSKSLLNMLLFESSRFRIFDRIE